MKKLIKKIILGCLVGVLVVAMSEVIAILCQPLWYEVWDSYLKRDENQQLDTTQENNVNAGGYQIVGGKLYYLDEDEEHKDCLYQYDYVDSTEECLIRKKDIYDFQIVDNRIYYTVPCKDDEDVLENLICRDIDGKKTKLRERIEGFVCRGKDIFYYRYGGRDENFFKLYQLMEDGEDKLVLSKNVDDGPSEFLFMYEDYVFFGGAYNEGYISAYNLQTGTWREYFNMTAPVESRDNKFFYQLLDVQYADGNIFAQGYVCDSSKSNRLLTSPFYPVDDAPETGVWQINLATGEQSHIDQNYFSEICALGGKLYGVRNGKCKLLYG